MNFVVLLSVFDLLWNVQSFFLESWILFCGYFHFYIIIMNFVYFINKTKIIQL